jgi:hypothetical protein
MAASGTKARHERQNDVGTMAASCLRRMINLEPRPIQLKIDFAVTGEGRGVAVRWWPRYGLPHWPSCFSSHQAL